MFLFLTQRKQIITNPGGSNQIVLKYEEEEAQETLECLGHKSCWCNEDWLRMKVCRIMILQMTRVEIRWLCIKDEMIGKNNGNNKQNVACWDKFENGRILT